MIKRQFIVILLLLLSITLVQCQETIDDSAITKEPVTELMIIEQEKLCIDKDEIKAIEKDIRAFVDTTSVSEIKKIIKENYKYTLTNKEEIIEQLEGFRKSTDDDFLSKTRLYLLDEERYEERENTYKELVNNNHKHYRDTIGQGAYFDQIFKNNESSLKTIVRNNGFTVFKFSNEESIQPYYSLNFDSEKELKIMNIYYHDGTVDSSETTIPEHSFPLNSIPVNKMKHIDSLQMEFKVKYVSQIDSVHFDKNEIGVKKGDFKLLKMDKNYVEYETPNDYYPYHVGSILEEEFYNKEGKVLDTEYGYGNLGLQTVEEDYIQRLDLRREYYEYVTIAKTKGEVVNALKYVQLKNHNSYLKETRKEKQLLQGNVESFTIYQEKKRDTITFLATLKNANELKNMYIHELEEETEFIDQNGEKITSLPFSIRFLYLSQGSIYSDKYFFADDDSYGIDDREYFYIDQEEQVVITLPYSRVEFLCKSILMVSEKDNEGFKLLSTEENKLLSDETFNRFFIMRYTDEGVLVYNDEGSFLLLDQNGEVITENSGIVTKITLKKVEY